MAGVRMSRMALALLWPAPPPERSSTWSIAPNKMQNSARPGNPVTLKAERQDFMFHGNTENAIALSIDF